MLLLLKGADYLLMVKGNQPTLQKAIKMTFIDAAVSQGFDRQCMAEKSHGRIVGRMTSVLPAMGVVDQNDWSKCQTIGRIDSIRRIGDQ